MSIQRLLEPAPASSTQAASIDLVASEDATDVQKEEEQEQQDPELPRDQDEDGEGRFDLAVGLGPGPVCTASTVVLAVLAEGAARVPVL